MMSARVLQSTIGSVFLVGLVLMSSSFTSAASLPDVTGSWKTTFMGKELTLDIVQFGEDEISQQTTAKIHGVLRVPYSADTSLYHVNGAHIQSSQPGLNGVIFYHQDGTDEGHLQITSFVGSIQNNKIVGTASRDVYDKDTMKVTTGISYSVTLIRDASVGKTPDPKALTRTWQVQSPSIPARVDITCNSPEILQGQNVAHLSGTLMVDYPLNPGVLYHNLMGFAQAGGRVFLLDYTLREYGDGVVPIIRTFTGTVHGDEITGGVLSQNTGERIEGISLSATGATNTFGAMPSVLRILDE